jgi:hypothetical protein
LTNVPPSPHSHFFTFSKLALLSNDTLPAAIGRAVHLMHLPAG